MKRFMATIAAVLCCAMIPVGNIQAQDEGKITFSVSQGKKETLCLYGDDNFLDLYTPYKGEGLHSG